LECWSVGVLECWSVGVLECWSGGVAEWRSGGVWGSVRIAPRDGGLEMPEPI